LSDPFAPEEVQAWVQALLEAREVGVLRQALQPGNADPDDTEADLILAAACTVAAGLGLVVADLPGEVAGWLQVNKRLDLAALLPLARVQLGRVVADQHGEPARRQQATVLLARLHREVAIQKGCG